MKFVYSGTDNNGYSLFLLGKVSSHWISEFKREVEIHCFDSTNLIHYTMISYYIRKNYVDLWKWINSVQLSFGGDVELIGDTYRLSLLLSSNSAEECAFRLRFNVT